LNHACLDEAEYGVTVRANYDVTGRSDSRLKVTCPAFIPLNVVLKGTDPPFPRKEIPSKKEESCCLPF